MAQDGSGERTARAVVITGASTGIGAHAALHLDRLGYQVFAGVRRDEDAAQLRQHASSRLVPVHLDVTEQRTIDDAAEVVRSIAPGGLAGLVNNAGIAMPGPLEYLSLDRMRRQLEVNVVGQLAVTQAFLPHIRLGHGRIVFVGSIAGRVATPLLGPYAASKHALEALTDSLRLELRPWGIEVSILEPGVIATPIWAKGLETAEELYAELPEEAMSRYGDVMEQMSRRTRQLAGGGLPPEAVSSAIEHALTAKRPKTRYLVGGDAKRNAFLRRWVPDRLRDRLVARYLGLTRVTDSRRADP